MIRYQYEQLDHQTTSKEIMLKYSTNIKGTPFNVIVIGLGKRIIKSLNRFEVIGTEDNKSYFIIPFKGWHEDFDANKNFVWKIRDELVQAVEELNIFKNTIERADFNDDLENIISLLIRLKTRKQPIM